MSAEEAHNEEISPEEKLLKVIQEEQEEQPAEPTPAPSLPPKVPKHDAPKPEVADGGQKTVDRGPEPQAKQAVQPKPKVKPKLKAKPKAKEGARKTKPAGKPKAGKAKVGMTGGGPTLRVAKGGKKGGGLGIRTTNRILAVAAVLLVGLAAWEIYGAIQQGAMDGAGDGLPQNGGGSASPRPVMIRTPEEILPDMAAASIFQNLVPAAVRRPPNGTGGTTQTTTVTRTVEPVEKLIRARLSWKAQVNTPGGLKALVADKKSSGMHALKEGDKIDMDGQLVVLEKIERDRLIFASGETKVHLKPSGG
jgi:hypothetical protein